MRVLALTKRGSQPMAIQFARDFNNIYDKGTSVRFKTADGSYVVTKTRGPAYHMGSSGRLVVPLSDGLGTRPVADLEVIPQQVGSATQANPPTSPYPYPGMSP